MGVGAQTMYTHMNKCKNNKKKMKGVIKGGKTEVSPIISSITYESNCFPLMNSCSLHVDWPVVLW
jgi:hypothetical protein